LRVGATLDTLQSESILGRYEPSFEGVVAGEDGEGHVVEEARQLRRFDL
jgi:hypothetical protein